MKITLFLTAFIATVFLAPTDLPAQTTNRAPGGLNPELQTIVQSVQSKLKAGKNTEVDLAADLVSFDQLLAKHAGEKTDDVAQILYMKAMLYLQVLDNADKGKMLIQKLKSDYPDTKLGKRADQMLLMMDKQAEAKKIHSALTTGSVFPDFNVNSLTGQPLSVAALKGKVVLVDFWATWCGPCRAELPNVIAAYKKFHGQGFEVIGVSLDGKRDRLDSFLKENSGVAWPQFFEASADGGIQNWSNKLAGKYGVESIPFTILVGPDGKIIGMDLRGDDLGVAVAKALVKK